MILYFALTTAFQASNFKMSLETFKRIMYYVLCEKAKAPQV